MNMQIDDTQYSSEGIERSFHICTCNGSDPDCSICAGLGHLYLPCVCLSPGCHEGFESFTELSKHYQEVHDIFPINFQS
jgi:hypothetical protein